MENKVSLKIKARDIVVGFFGWIILHNLLTVVGLAAMSASFDKFWLLLAILWLAAIIAPLVLFVKKRIWVALGIAAAIMINIGLWAFLGGDVRPVIWILPLPLGGLIMSQ